MSIIRIMEFLSISFLWSTIADQLFKNAWKGADLPTQQSNHIYHESNSSRKLQNDIIRSSGYIRILRYRFRHDGPDRSYAQAFDWNTKTISAVFINSTFIWFHFLNLFQLAYTRLVCKIAKNLKKDSWSEYALLRISNKLFTCANLLSILSLWIFWVRILS